MSYLIQAFTNIKSRKDALMVLPRDPSVNAKAPNVQWSIPPSVPVFVLQWQQS